MMSEKSCNSRTSSAKDLNSGSSYTSQLRRLKIQEGILSANVNKSLSTYLEKCDEVNKLNTKKDINAYIFKLKDSYTELRNLYEDIKIKTNCEEVSDITDINDLKRDVLELENKMKNLKQFLRDELSIMQSEEITLMEKSNENQIEERKFIIFPKSKPNHLKEIVSSPVKNIINAPLKCNEIHEFQVFMKNSPNRFGGWNEYSHNLFVKIWNKYNGNEEFSTKSNDNSRLYQDFKEEALHKLSGIYIEDLNSHIEWYSRYIYLKTCQRIALEKWKDNKRKIKKPLRESKVCNWALQSSSKCLATNDSDNGRAIKNSANIKENKQHQNHNKLDRVSTLMQPTKQSLNRRECDKEISTIEYDIENIARLRVPEWRMNLKVKK